MTYIFNYHIFNNISPFTQKMQGFNSRQISFENSSDCFITNPISNAKTLNKDNVIKCAASNSNILSILNKYNIPFNPNMEELEKLERGHLKDTRIWTAKIYSNLPPNLKKEVNLVDLQTAAMLHDYGKIFIPNKILNKKDSLTAQEKEIIEQHSELGYELLKTQGINSNVLNLIKYHHQTFQGNGYPKTNKSFEYNISLDILRCADKYSALRENRSYKVAKTPEESLKLLQEDVNNGNLSPEVYNALLKAIKQ